MTPRPSAGPGQGPLPPTSPSEIARTLEKQVKKNQKKEAGGAVKPVKVVALKAHWDGARLWEEGQAFIHQQKAGEKLPPHLVTEAEYLKSAESEDADELDED